MTVLWYVARRAVRTRAQACLAVAVLLALLGGLSLASFAGARRTASAYARFRNAGQALNVYRSMVTPSAAAITSIGAPAHAATMASSSSSVRVGSWWNSASFLTPASAASSIACSTAA